MKCLDRSFNENTMFGGIRLCNLLDEMFVDSGNYRVIGEPPSIDTNPRVLQYEHLGSGSRIKVTTTFGKPPSFGSNVLVEVLDEYGNKSARDLIISELSMICR